MTTPQGVAPAARMISTDSRTEVPAEMTSSIIRSARQRRTDDVAALAVILGFLAVEGEGKIVASAGQR